MRATAPEPRSCASPTWTPTPGEPMSIPSAAGEIRIVGTPASRAEALQRVSEVVAAAAGKTGLRFFARRSGGARCAGTRHAPRAARAVACRRSRTRRGSTVRSLTGCQALDRRGQYRRDARSRGSPFISCRQRHRTSVKQIAAVQYAVAVIPGFAPLPRKMNPAVPTTAYDDVKRVALARLFLEDVPSIQVDWSLYGPKLAQVALTVGANDVDAVSPLDDNAEGRRRAPLEEIRRNIRAAGLDPVERDGRFDLHQLMARVRLGAVGLPQRTSARVRTRSRAAVRPALRCAVEMR